MSVVVEWAFDIKRSRLGLLEKSFDCYDPLSFTILLKLGENVYRNRTD
jgi:hypothetical protein